LTYDLVYLYSKDTTAAHKPPTIKQNRAVDTVPALKSHAIPLAPFQVTERIGLFGSPYMVLGPRNILETHRKIVSNEKIYPRTLVALAEKSKVGRLSVLILEWG
tara:strand:+ start:1684 stop:1995 length:312 start_codon:yes stop_codon:yes gene_type:complete